MLPGARLFRPVTLIHGQRVCHTNGQPDRQREQDRIAVRVQHRLADSQLLDRESDAIMLLAVSEFASNVSPA
jgi:hypothetical protein